ncbi:hypothetical protein [Pseudooceanicola sp. C21-150M6]|uniref:hypothetical protein n=1 Tax=Pseudooceanicola sp. C21-150M6 TaxID=3434355 RepID=UPI003D7F8F2C
MILISAAVCQEPKIWTGDHDGFTRIAFRLAVADDYKISIEEGAVRVKFPNVNSFDTSSIFQRISRDRLHKIEHFKAGRSLKIEYICDCLPVFSLQEPGVFVVDIGDKYSSTKNEGQVARKLINFPTATGLEDRSNSEAIDTISRDRHYIVEAKKLKTDPLHGGLEPRLGIQSLNNLIRKLTNGIDLGLLDIMPRGENPSAKDNLSRKYPPTMQNVPIEIQRSADDLNKLGKTHSENKCAGKIFFDVSHWSRRQSFQDGLRNFEFNILEVTETKNSVSALKYARRYLYFGLGSEAKHIILHSQDSSREGRLLLAIAEIVNGDVISDSVALDEQRNCRNGASLWRALGKLDQGAIDIEKERELLGHFRSLPNDLRRTISARFISYLLGAGATESAEIVYRMFEDDEVNAELEFSKGQIELAEGRVDNAMERFESVYLGQSSKSIQSLTQLIRLRADRTEAISPELGNSVESFIYQGGDLSDMDGLTTAGVLSAAGVGDVDKAWRRLEIARKRIDVDFSPITNLVGNYMLLSSGVSFLMAFNAMSDYDAIQLTEENQMAIFDRLSGLGFEDLANDFRSKTGLNYSSNSERISHSVELLRDRKYSDVLLALEGVDTGSATKVRVISYLGLDMVDAAKIEFEKVINKEDFLAFFRQMASDLNIEKLADPDLLALLAVLRDGDEDDAGKSQPIVEGNEELQKIVAVKDAIAKLVPDVVD